MLSIYEKLSSDIHELLELKVEVDQRMEVEKLVTKSCREWDNSTDKWKAGREMERERETDRERKRARK